MNGIDKSLVERLAEAENPRDSQNWEDREGYYVATCRVSASDIPGLINLVQEWSDPNWPRKARLPKKINVPELLPVTAWRTLADLQAEAAVQPLVAMLRDLDDSDDWACEDLPHVFGKIGEAAIEPLIHLAQQCEQPDYIRSIAACGLRQVAHYHPDRRERVVAALTEMMAHAQPDVLDFNTTLLVELVDLGAVEAAEPIERAFAADLVDVGMMGDWESVRQKLGVEGLKLPMPAHPHNSVARLRTQLGVGVFSDQLILALGEVDADAEQAYYEKASDAFSKSSEAQQFIERHGELGWYRMLLEFGLHELAETVDTMTLGGVKEFLLDYVPRNVSTEADSAASIVEELAGFWGYLDRVHELPEAKSIVAWLNSEDLVAQLQAALADPSKFSVAKAFVMAGKRAGYDMTSQEEIQKFAAEYHRSPSPSLLPKATPIVREARVGRNEPCPCGSGKKYKKCCGR